MPSRLPDAAPDTAGAALGVEAAGAPQAASTPIRRAGTNRHMRMFAMSFVPASFDTCVDNTVVTPEAYATINKVSNVFVVIIITTWAKITDNDYQYFTLAGYRHINTN